MEAFSYWMGLATIPLVLLAVLAIYGLAVGGVAFHRRFLSWKLVPGDRCYAYVVTAASGRMAHELIGSTFIERRDLGAEYSYTIEHDGEGATRLTAKRVPGGGRYTGGHPQWDTDTAGILDEVLKAHEAAKGQKA